MKIGILFILIFGMIAESRAAVPTAPIDASKTDPNSEATSEVKESAESVTPVAAAPEPVKRRRPKTSGDQYQKSKLTSDRSEAEADTRQLVLATGVDKIIDLDPSINIDDFKKEILIGNVRLLTIAPSHFGKATRLIIRPLEEGETSITIFDKSGKVKIIFDAFVAKQNLVHYVERLRDKLKEVEGISINIEDQKVVIRGEVLSPNDYGIIINELSDKAYGDSVLNKVTMSNVTLNALARKIEDDLKVFAPTVKTSVLNGKIILEGSVESKAQKDRALQRAEWYLPAVKVSEPISTASNIEKNDKPLNLIQSDIQVTPPPPKRESKLVRLSVYFVELSKDFLKTFGFKWQPGFTADPSISIGTPTGVAGAANTGGGFTFSGTLSSLFPSLNAPPSSASYGRILKTETVVVKSADKARVTDTQSIPTQTLGQNGTVGNGAPVTVGFQTEITPTIIQNQDVDLNIDLDQTNQIGQNAQGTPLTSNHHLTTRLYLKSGEVGAVAGVNTQDVTTAFNRDDANAGTFGAGTKPLFTLMRSKNMKKARGQFVVFVSPQIIESASEGTEDLKKNFRMKSN